MASHALLLCKVVRKCARFASATASADAPIAVLITPESLTADSCAYPCGAWSSSGGVASRGDGVGDGDSDSEGVELVEWVKLRRECPYAGACV